MALLWLTLGLLGVAWSIPIGDEILNLPGSPEGKLPCRMFSGYVDVMLPRESVVMHVHYWFVVKESQGDKADQSTPIILWSNGGPGASSLFGLLGEIGPLLLNDESLKDASDVPSLIYNGYNWARLGHLLVFDWPPPVGFSFCGADSAGGGNSCGEWDDDRMTDLMFAALKTLLGTKFGEIKRNPLFLTGESYAGVYIPRLAKAIINDVSGNFPWNLQGFAVGDPCAGTEVSCGNNGLGPWWNLIFLYGHGQFSIKLFDKIVGSCGMPYLKYLSPAVDAGACNAALAQVKEEVGGYYVYHLYDDCIYEDELSQASNIRAGSATQGALNDYACGTGPVQTKWLARKDVREAIHVPVTSNFFSGDNGQGMTYHTTERNLMPFYESVALSDVRVLIYNGDADVAINSFVTQNWTSALGLPEQESWRPWTLDGCLRMGGYVTRYKGDVDFLTIRGAGHMVPEYKGEATFEFMKRWLQNKNYPRYDANCKMPETRYTGGALDNLKTIA